MALDETPSVATFILIINVQLIPTRSRALESVMMNCIRIFAKFKIVQIVNTAKL